MDYAVEEIQQHADAVSKAVGKLQAENDRLKAQCEDRWKHIATVGQLQREVEDLKRRLEKALADGDQNRNDARHWRKAVRYEQALKRPRKRVHHLPIYNDVQRAKRRDGQPNTCFHRTNPERIFLKHWRKENRGVGGVNGGRGVLEIILSEDNTVADLTQRDATVAATVIQWLGTNCGHAFIYEVEREIKSLREAESREARKAAV